MNRPEFYLYEEDLRRAKEICEKAEEDDSAGFTPSLVFLNSLLKRVDKSREGKKGAENDLLPYIWVMIDTAAQALRKLSISDKRVRPTAYRQLRYVSRELGKVITR